jgi:sigma-E factor negative regulatory protein RseC
MSADAVICVDAGEVMRRTLTVAAVQGSDVILSAPRASACSGCAARSGCGAGALTEVLGGTDTLRLPRTVPLEEGDEVVVAMSERRFLGAVLRAYLLPAVALALLAGIGLALDLPDAVIAGLSLPVLAIAFLPAIRADRRERLMSALWLEPVKGAAG